jgi:hypothetical protein
VSGLSASLRATVARAAAEFDEVRERVEATVGGHWRVGIGTPRTDRREYGACGEVDLVGRPRSPESPSWSVVMEVVLVRDPMPLVSIHGSVGYWPCPPREYPQIDLGYRDVDPDVGPETAVEMALDLERALISAIADNEGAGGDR